MVIAATLAFESVYTAWGKNDSSLLKADFISAEALARLKRLMEARKTERRRTRSASTSSPPG
jgi:predicted lipid-binding transport protein (Tim44 family)